MRSSGRLVVDYTYDCSAIERVTDHKFAQVCYQDTHHAIPPFGRGVRFAAVITTTALR